MAYEAPRLLADQDLPGRSGLLQARRGVHDVADDDVRVAVCALPGSYTDDELAGVDARAHREAHAPVALQLIVEPVQLARHRSRRANRAQRVVLAHDGRAEDRHDGVADELLKAPAVLLDDRAHDVVEERHDRAHRLGVERLLHRGRSCKVRKNDRDRLAPRPRLGVVHRRSTGAAVVRRGRHLGAT